MGRLELSRPKSPPPQECLPKYRKQHKYKNLHIKPCSIGLKIVAVPVI
jgi:hypothetical protein